MPEFNAHVYGLGYTCNHAGQRIAMKQPAALGSDSTRWVWNTTRGLLESLIDWKGNTTGFSYDSSGRLTQIAHPGSWYDDREYDAGGNLTWNRQGEVVRILQVTCDWFLKWRSWTSTPARERPPVHCLSVQEDDAGRIRVLAAVADANWVPDTPLAGRREGPRPPLSHDDRMWDTILEVIDADNGQPIRSQRLPERYRALWLGGRLVRLAEENGDVRNSRGADGHETTLLDPEGGTMDRKRRPISAIALSIALAVSGSASPAPSTRAAQTDGVRPESGPRCHGCAWLHARGRSRVVSRTDPCAGSRLAHTVGRPVEESLGRHDQNVKSGSSN